VPTRDGVELRVTAEADEGFELVGDREWSHVFVAADGCLPVHPLAAGLVSVTHASCQGDTDSFTAVAVEGIAYRLTLDGTTTALSPGTVVSVRRGTPYRVTAIAVDPYGLDPGYPSTWTFTFVAPTCLPTLPFTGASPWLGVLGIAGFLSVLVGVLLAVFARPVRARHLAA